MLKEKNSIYGNGKNIRDWIYVKDHCEAIIKIMKKGKLGENYNIGSADDDNITLAQKICKIINKNSNKFRHESLIEFVEDRKRLDFRYAIDSTKVKKMDGNLKLIL